MIAKLKKTALGKILYRLSRSSFGAPLRRLSRLLQSEQMNLSHLRPAHRAHNRAQVLTLSRFETRTRAH